MRKNTFQVYHPQERQPHLEKIIPQINSAAEFAAAVEGALAEGKRPVFSGIQIDHGELCWPLFQDIYGPVLTGDIRSHQIENVTITSAIIGTMTENRLTLKTSTLQAEVRDNRLAKANFSGSSFEQAISRNNFQLASFYRVKFKQTVADCDFTHADLTEAIFHQEVTGLVCFSGANLATTRFEKECGPQVIFIGSHLNFDDRPKGGIHNVPELKAALQAQIFPDLERLHAMLKQSHAIVTEVYGFMNELRYHLNHTHCDLLNQAVVAVGNHIAEQAPKADARSLDQSVAIVTTSTVALFAPHQLAVLASLLGKTHKQIPSADTVQLIFKTEREAQACQKQLLAATQSAAATSAVTDYLIEKITMFDEGASASAASAAESVTECYAITFTKAGYNYIMQDPAAYDDLLETFQVMQARCG